MMMVSRGYVRWGDAARLSDHAILLLLERSHTSVAWILVKKQDVYQQVLPKQRHPEEVLDQPGRALAAALMLWPCVTPIEDTNSSEDELRRPRNCQCKDCKAP